MPTNMATKYGRVPVTTFNPSSAPLSKSRKRALPLPMQRGDPYEDDRENVHPQVGQEKHSRSLPSFYPPSRAFRKQAGHQSRASGHKAGYCGGPATIAGFLEPKAALRAMTPMEKCKNLPR